MQGLPRVQVRSQLDYLHEGHLGEVTQRGGAVTSPNPPPSPIPPSCKRAPQEQAGMLPELERSIDNEITNKIEDNNTIETTPKIKTTILALKPPSKHQKPLKKKRTTTILKQDNEVLKK